jgi:HrpA-like RNA helicase
MREQDKMKDKQLHLIYVEDQTKFHEEMKETAAQKKIRLTPYEFGEDAFNAYDPYVHDGIILDIRGKWNRQDTEERNYAFMQCQKRIELIQKDLNSELPWVVYTGFPMELKNYLNEDEIKERLFIKNDTDVINTMFDKMINMIKELPFTDFKSAYGDVLDVIEKKYFDQDKAEMMKDLLLKQDEIIEPYSVIEKCGSMRTILEHVYKLLMEILYPRGNENKGSLSGMIKLVAGKPKSVEKHIRALDKRLYVVESTKKSYQPLFLYDLALINNWVNNQMVHDLYDKKMDDHYKYQPSRYTFLTMLNSLCEIIVWMGKFMDINQSSKELKQDK